ncbi:patched [Penaeus vannamei]|uniref:Patched n=1 Tax=Penaeus vannamei TaxID=6689 RepID=A0A423UAB6_PENVA|nr:patched [Penaeus vannamei]
MTEGYNFSDFDEQNLVCQVSGCKDDSMLQQIFISSLKPERSYIASGASSWLSPYFTWLKDNVGSGFTIGACCRLDSDGNFINSSASYDMDTATTCMQPGDFEDGRPHPNLFMKHLEDYLSDNPHDTMCPSAGHPAYGDAVRVLERPSGETYVGANYFMAYHSILKTSEDFINAMDFAYQLSASITDYLQNIFYVYYEQYLTMWADTGVSLGVSVASVFGVLLLLTFDLASSIIVLVTIAMIVVDMMGMMFWWNISLNAVSLAVGISVEFCSHVTHAFATSVQPTRLLRAQEALSTMGSSVPDSTACWRTRRRRERIKEKKKNMEKPTSGSSLICTYNISRQQSFPATNQSAGIKTCNNGASNHSAERGFINNSPPLPLPLLPGQQRAAVNNYKRSERQTDHIGRY